MAVEGVGELTAARASGVGRMSVRDRVFAWLAVVMLAFMAVGWRSLGDTPIGLLRYFTPPLALIILLARNRMRLFADIKSISVAFTYYTALYAVICFYNRISPLAITQGIYVAGAFSLAAVLRGGGVAQWRIYRWAGPLSALFFTIFFFSDATKVGVDPISIVKQGLFHNNRNLIEFGLFQPVFNASSPQNLFNSTALRGQIVAGVLVSMLYSLYAQSAIRRDSARRRSISRGGEQRTLLTDVAFYILFGTSLVLAAVLTVVSLARALELDFVIAALFPLARVLFRGRARLTTALGVLVGLATVAVSIVTPVASLLASRVFSDTGSYSARTQAVSAAFRSIQRSPLLGTNTALIDPTQLGPHNFVLDATVNAGIVVGLLALAVVVLLFRDVFRGLGAYFADKVPLWTVAAAIFGPVAMFTSGGGTMQIPDCMGLALFYGTMTFGKGNRRPEGVDDNGPRTASDLVTVGSDRSGSSLRTM